MLGSSIVVVYPMFLEGQLAEGSLSFCCPSRSESSKSLLTRSLNLTCLAVVSSLACTGYDSTGLTACVGKSRVVVSLKHRKHLIQI